MPRHLLPVAVDVDRLPALLRQLDRELDREPVRRRERERLLAGDRLLAGELLEHLQPALQRLAEALLLGAYDPLDRLPVLDHLRVPRPDLVGDDPRDAVDVLQPDPPRLDDRAPDQPAQHVAAALIRGRHALGDEEGHAAPVVGDDPVRLRRSRRVVVADARLAGDPVHDQAEAVGVEDRLGALEQHRAALEAHAGVDVLLRQRRQRPVRVEVELHEDEVPKLDVAVAILAVRATRLESAAELLASVEVELGARAARPGLARGAPEVVAAREGDDPLSR